MTRYIPFLLLAAGLPICTRGQFTNSGAQVVVSGGYLVVDDLNMVNNGTFSHNAGTVTFSGNNNTAIAGTGTTQFYALQLNKPGAQLQLQTNINIDNQLLFTNGLLDLNNNNITLAPSAYLNGESENNRITGTTGGYVEITNVLNAPAAANPGNLGVVITSPASLGSTVIRRGHVSQSNGLGMLNSIFRYYDIMPANNTGLNATIGINYFDAELNGLGESILSVYKSPNTTSWSDLGHNTRNTATNYVDQINVASLARFTLSSEMFLLPVMINDLHTKCINNQVVITWQSPGVINTGTFIISRSANGIQWQPVATIPITNSHTYAYTDAQSFNGAWYRITTEESNGHQTVSPAVQSNCGVNEAARVFPNPAYSNAWLQLEAAAKTTVIMHLYDHTGALVKLNTANASVGLNQFDLQMNSLPQGIYSLVVHWGNGEVKTIKVVKL
ncbi:hypothetical protein A4H97_22985 [Niastella yeongjuensis]|uniref:Secretion system C-terminal sorting domain-containing protein n=1 Tax=Niastella yeongjuensis TaxID=354355 RepID=A0A1V9F7F2_9BACT|nr:T9SS type A sorting domain-containing protein [Niastella yeongjuensis]OQP54349.1 hypothetical protein A4H97_22985 [Niastella yeongjuensis]SEP29714.1 Por secretion system C-terminal sorting domain-containing protein [Niastella yeongjuensis]